VTLKVAFAITLPPLSPHWFSPHLLLLPPSVALPCPRLVASPTPFPPFPARLAPPLLGPLTTSSLILLAQPPPRLSLTPPLLGLACLSLVLPSHTLVALPPPPPPRSSRLALTGRPAPPHPSLVASPHPSFVLLPPIWLSCPAPPWSSLPHPTPPSVASPCPPLVALPTAHWPSPPSSCPTPRLPPSALSPRPHGPLTSPSLVLQPRPPRFSLPFSPLPDCLALPALVVSPHPPGPSRLASTVTMTTAMTKRTTQLR
jgi:hypothetical protein